MKNQLIIYLLTLACIGNLTAQNCQTDIVFWNQVQIDNFPNNYPGCSEILGSITIQEGIQGNITNLDSLIQITYISEHLIIKENPTLSSLAGLQNLDSIGGALEISQNIALQSLDGLNNLTVIGYYVEINLNGLLENLLGLSSLSSVGPLLRIRDEPSLTHLTGLENIVSLPGNLIIQGNNALNDLNGLNNLKHIDGSLSLTFNYALTDLSGLDSLLNIEERLFLSSVDNLVSLNGLNSLQSVNELYFHNCHSLEDISGLENITSFESIQIFGSHYLENLDAIENADLSTLSELILQENYTLSACGQSNICNYIMTGGEIVLANNAPGCNTISEILQACFEDVNHTSLIGQFRSDVDLDCTADSSDLEIPGWLVHASYDQYSYGVSTDIQGNYWLPTLEGEWLLKVISPSSFWTPCFEDSLITTTAMNDSIITDFYMQPLGDCSFIDWDINMPNLRPCTNQTLVVDFCNFGTQAAEDAIMSVTLDSFLTFQGASLPYTMDTLGNILFEFDDLDIFECGQFTIEVFVDCDSLELWDIQCIHAELMNEELCSPDSTWDSSTISVNGFCENDSIHFELQNIGNGNMAQPAQFRVEIVIDDIVLMLDADDYQLDVSETQMLSYHIDGMNVMGMRLEADQTPSHPVSESASVVVPNCEEMVNNIILNLLPSEDGNPFEESFCGIVTNSYDPNLKSAVPVGTGDLHEIDKSWKLDYTLQFQNTGNDTAFLVVLRDTLSENLDLTTLRVHGGSHPFTWALNPERELVFTFENILLPDSTTNEAEAHGFVSFSINPRSDLFPGDLIENRVGIYFDFNDPVITNTVFHTIRKPVVASSEDLDWCVGEEFMGQAVTQDTTVQVFTSFIEYDSVHFVHLEVVSLFQDTVSVEVETGTHFENVLINGDTTFTINYLAQNSCDSLVTYIIGGLTTIEKLANAFKNVSVFPNPAKDHLMVVNHENDEEQVWSLMNNLGREVWSRQLKINETLSGIPLAPLPSGVYLLKVNTESATAIWKIIKL